jgi:hypothetical protein
MVGNTHLDIRGSNGMGFQVRGIHDFHDTSLHHRRFIAAITRNSQRKQAKFKSARSLQSCWCVVVNVHHLWKLRAMRMWAEAQDRARNVMLMQGAWEGEKLTTNIKSRPAQRKAYVWVSGSSRSDSVRPDRWASQPVLHSYQHHPNGYQVYSTSHRNV